jgi:hypothetical protein
VDRQRGSDSEAISCSFSLRTCQKLLLATSRIESRTYSKPCMCSHFVVRGISVCVCVCAEQLLQRKADYVARSSKSAQSWRTVAANTHNGPVFS